MHARATQATVLLAVVAFFFLAALYLIRQENTAPAPSNRLSWFETAEIDLGEQIWGGKAQLSLRFVNRGDSSITIEKIKSSCACTAVDKKELEGRTLSPGASADIDMQVNLGNHPGRKHNTVSVILADGREWKAHVRYAVIPTWRLSEQAVHFGSVSLDEEDAYPIRHSVMFSSSSIQLAEQPRPDVPWIACQTADRGDAGVEIIVTLLKEKLPPGKSYGGIFFETTCERARDGVIYVTAQGVQEIVALPSHVFLVGQEPVLVSLRDAAGEAFHVESIHVSNPGISATVLSAGQLEIRNKSNDSIAAIVVVRARDGKGRVAKILVSTL